MAADPAVPVKGCADTYTVDSLLYGVDGALSQYVLDDTEPVVVDTGAANTTGRTYAALDALGIEREAVRHVLVTHVHLDHAGGAGEFAREFPNATFYLHEQGYDYVTDPYRLAALKRSVDRAMGTEDAYGNPDLVPEDRAVVVSDGQRLDAGDHVFRFVDAPGHAPHHFAALDETTGGLFSIDAAGMYQAGEMRPTTPPPSFDLAANLDTVRRLRDMDPETNLYGHFGPGETGEAVAGLDRYESMLPEWVAFVDEHRDGRPSVSEILEVTGPEWRSPTVQRDVAGVLRYLEECDEREQSEGRDDGPGTTA
jgi:glyoxylase-like metal-dependent hydrolase (beta-lactamase superfamily II)